MTRRELIAGVTAALAVSIPFMRKTASRPPDKLHVEWWEQEWPRGSVHEGPTIQYSLLYRDGMDIVFYGRVVPYLENRAARWAQRGRVRAELMEFARQNVHALRAPQV